MSAENTPTSQILNKRKDNCINLPQGSMKTSRKQKLHHFPHSIIPKAPLILTILELVSKYDYIEYLYRSLSNTFNLYKLNYTSNKSTPQ